MEEQYIPASKKCVHAINDILSVISESFQNTPLEFMSKRLNTFGDMLDQLVTASEKSKIVRQKAYTAVFKIKNSLQDILDESRIHRYSHEQCQELLKRLEDTIKFEQMEIGIFLEKHELTEYSKLFDAERIMYAGELVDAYDELLELVKPNMKIGSYARYRKSVTKEKKSREYIETELQGDLEKLERQFTEASGKIGAKLKSFLKDLEPVVDELSQVIKDKKKRREIYIGLAVSGVVVLAAAYGAVAIPCLVWGIKGLITCFEVESLALTAYGGLTALFGTAAISGISSTVYKEQDKMKKEVSKLEESEKMVTQWQEEVRSQFLHWRKLVSTFTELFDDLRNHHDQYKDHQTEINKQFDETHRILDVALQQTKEFEEMVKALRDKKVTQVDLE